MANAVHVDMFEFMAVSVVDLPDGATFDAEIGGTLWAVDWEDAEAKMRAQTESPDCKLKKCEMVRHTVKGNRVTRHINCGEQPCTYKPKTEDKFFWLGDCQGVTSVKNSTVWQGPGEFPKGE